MTQNWMSSPTKHSTRTAPTFRFENFWNFGKNQRFNTQATFARSTEGERHVVVSRMDQIQPSNALVVKPTSMSRQSAGATRGHESCRTSGFDVTRILAFPNFL